MVMRSLGGKLPVRRPEGYGHNSGEIFSDLKELIRTAKIEFWPIDQLRLGARNLRSHSPRKLAALRRGHSQRFLGFLREGLWSAKSQHQVCDQLARQCHSART